MVPISSHSQGIWTTRPAAEMLSPPPAVCTASEQTRIGARQIWTSISSSSQQVRGRLSSNIILPPSWLHDKETLLCKETWVRTHVSMSPQTCLDSCCSCIDPSRTPRCHDCVNGVGSVVGNLDDWWTTSCRWSSLCPTWRRSYRRRPPPLHVSTLTPG